MQPAKPTTIYFSFNPVSSRWVWTSALPNPKFEKISKGHWRQFSLWVARQDKGRAGFEEAVDQFKRVIEDTNSHILVVDDDSSMLMLLTLILNLGGYWVRTASDGYEGLEILSREEFALLSLDIMMAGMDGIQALEQIRADPHWDTMPIMMCSARGDSKTISYCLELGADAFLTKPFSPAELREQVQTLLVEGRKKSNKTVKKARRAKKKKS